QPAIADPTTLFCKALDGTITITINEARRTVSMRIIPENRGIENYGPLPAVFDSEKITYHVERWGDFTIDRLTVQVSIVTTTGLNMLAWNNCHVVKAQF
ncbi:MAG: hypothetical protein ABSE69_03135, partial [Roseiarcus sp.]